MIVWIIHRRILKGAFWQVSIFCEKDLDSLIKKSYMANILFLVYIFIFFILQNNKK